ncbi:PadR family transcriptional regulator [Subtercola boreus]|uniref:PadR family transcriptional regulator n=1 Tax=Subtercola boreus TaxID=120213 RepID=A0A3E0WEJ0_9MICO|nr:PadR family transcriptional regulator [Subtercola boreus]RFA22379.1 PadR family transcriptional regulator [Subtercola boreus]RFA22441.1 PadR family transcriptional regulator [Subtercola boreus]RFA28456.1 PadR family transcriptional regulator [Subtercola boreus]
MNPVFGHGHLRLYLLNLLAEQPRHGYELIQALSDRFGGTYSPSAGTIYPRLAKLEEEGLVTKATDGRKTVYEITDAGRAELNSRLPELSSIEDRVTDSVRMLADGLRKGVDEAMRSLRADLAAARRDATGEAPPRRDTTGAAPEAPGAAPHAAPDAAPDAPPEPTTDQLRQQNAESLRQVDAAVNGFRASVRTELRKRAARGTVSPAAVSTLTAELQRLEAELKAALRD